MSIHICTSDSLVADGDKMVLVCPVCCRKTLHTVGYIGGVCEVCNFLHTGDWNRVVAERRKRLKLSRSEMAKLYGCSFGTIRSYERSWPSRKYVEFTEQAIKAKYSDFHVEHSI